MKRIFCILAIALFAIFQWGCGSSKSASISAPSNGRAASVSSASLAGKKVLVTYFSATGNTKKVAEDIAKETGADVFRIEAAQPYASNPYQDTDRIKKEAFENERPEVKELLPEKDMATYDVIFVGSPIWWHQPAMVVCTFLEKYDLSGKTVIPFFTYGSRDYLNESMQRIYKSTPNSIHVPQTLPMDLEPDNIQEVQKDDAGIFMPEDASDTASWLRQIGVLP